MTETAVAERESQELTPAEQAELDVAKGAVQGLDDEQLTIPVLKIAQQLTAEVTEGDADSGNYVNALTGEDLGQEIEFVVAAVYKGRFYKRGKKDEDLPGEIGKVYVASEATAPSNWPEEWAGKPFADIPEAEEQYRVRVQNDEIEWGGGPPIRTTYNFIGFVPEDPGLPLRLTLMRSSAPAARKAITLIKASGVPWKHVFELDTERRENAERQPYYVASVKRGRQSTAEERAEALRLSQTVQSSNYKSAGDESLDDEEDRRKAAAKDSGGIDVT